MGDTCRKSGRAAEIGRCRRIIRVPGLTTTDGRAGGQFIDVSTGDRYMVKVGSGARDLTLSAQYTCSGLDDAYIRKRPVWVAILSIVIACTKITSVKVGSGGREL